MNPNYSFINVAQQEKDPDSILNFYRKAIDLRKTLSCVRDGDYKEYEKNSDDLYMYSRQNHRQRILVVCSFSSKAVRLKAPKGCYLDTAELVLGNYPNPVANTLMPWECRVYLWK